MRLTNTVYFKEITIQGDNTKEVRENIFDYMDRNGYRITGTGPKLIECGLKIDPRNIVKVTGRKKIKVNK